MPPTVHSFRLCLQHCPFHSFTRPSDAWLGALHRAGQSVKDCVFTISGYLKKSKCRVQHLQMKKLTIWAPAWAALQQTPPHNPNCFCAYVGRSMNFRTKMPSRHLQAIETSVPNDTTTRRSKVLRGKQLMLLQGFVSMQSQIQRDSSKPLQNHLIHLLLIEWKLCIYARWCFSDELILTLTLDALFLVLHHQDLCWSGKALAAQQIKALAAQHLITCFERSTASQLRCGVESQTWSGPRAVESSIRLEVIAISVLYPLRKPSIPSGHLFSRSEMGLEMWIARLDELHSSRTTWFFRVFLCVQEMPGAPSSVLAPSSDALCSVRSFLFLKAMASSTEMWAKH